MDKKDIMSVQELEEDYDEGESKEQEEMGIVSGYGAMQLGAMQLGVNDITEIDETTQPFEQSSVAQGECAECKRLDPLECPLH